MTESEQLWAELSSLMADEKKNKESHEKNGRMKIGKWLSAFAKKTRAEPGLAELAKQQSAKWSPEERSLLVSSAMTVVDLWKQPSHYYSLAGKSHATQRKELGLAAREALSAMAEWGWAGARTPVSGISAYGTRYAATTPGTLLYYSFLLKERELAGVLMQQPDVDARGALANCLGLLWLPEATRMIERMVAEKADFSEQASLAEILLLHGSGLGREWAGRRERTLDVLRRIQKAGAPIEAVAGAVFAGLGSNPEFPCKEALLDLAGLGMDLNARGKTGESPLSGAIKRSEYATIVAFLAAGADPFAADKDGTTPIDHARARRKPDAPSSNEELVWGLFKDMVGAREQARQIREEMARSQQELGAAVETLLGLGLLRDAQGAPLTREGALEWARQAQADARENAALAPPSGARRRL